MVTELTYYFMGPLLRVDIERVVADTVDDHEEDIVDLNREQLAEGQNADGSDIRPDYTEVTEFIKKSKGQRSDVVTLEDTGSFYRGFYKKRVPGGSEINSRDSKTAELVEKYRDGIFGLTVASRDELADRMKPTIQDKYRQAIR